MNNLFRNKPVRIIIGFFSAYIFFSCVEEPYQEIRQGADENFVHEYILTRSGVRIGSQDTLVNPYSISVMQEVYDTYSNNGEILEPTDIYVKFMPEDSSQLQTLIYNYKLELFNHPLNVHLEDGEVYIHDSLPETDLTWVYTTVKPDFTFPSEIPYQILEYCYIPEEDEKILIETKTGTEISVEELAFSHLGYDIEDSCVDTRATMSSPQGTIKVYDDTLKTFVPVKGIKVRCHNFVKWATAYTNTSGFYKMDTKFLLNASYSILCNNKKGFDIWANWGPISVAEYGFGWQSKSGYSININKSNQSWPWLVVNNAAYEYYEMCSHTGIIPPPAHLKIWIFEDSVNSSAPLLRNINDFIGLNGHSDIVNVLANVFYGVSVTMVNQFLKFALPDITIGTSGKTYYSIYCTVNHELSHASHFSQVGSAYWANYISYIMTYWGYGDGTGRNAELCGIGEMWGYAMGNIRVYEKYSESLANYPYHATAGWIYPHVFWNTYRDCGLSTKEIYDCLTSDVETYEDLLEKIFEKYPEYALYIGNQFVFYGLVSNFELPEGSIVYDTFFSNKVVSSDTLCEGDNVLIKNTTIESGVEFTVRGMDSITIEPPFVAESGCNLELIRGGI